MGLLLGPVLADIFMVELENNIVPLLQENLSLLKQYLDEPMFCKNRNHQLYDKET